MIYNPTILRNERIFWIQNSKINPKLVGKIPKSEISPIIVFSYINNSTIDKKIPYF
jgi:hypothetical protein